MRARGRSLYNVKKNSKQLIPRLLLRKMQQFLRTNIHVQWNLMSRISEGKETWFIKN